MVTSAQELPSEPAVGAGPVHTRALIIGTGFAGLGMGVALQRSGVDFLILEKADEVGGTWRENTYPGCACDVPSHLYSFSFDPKPDWKYVFSDQPEILEYLNQVADKHGLRRSIRFGSMVTVACLHRRGRGVHRTVPHLGSRRPAHPVATRHRGTDRFRRAGVPHRAVGPQCRVGR
jgi:cation diffusion facilitator CzcD-associated flavoprotein CzcO